jgi:hypothetical protein
MIYSADHYREIGREIYAFGPISRVVVLHLALAISNLIYCALYDM